MNLSTLGIVIGGINVISCVIASFYIIYNLIEIIQYEDDVRSFDFDKGFGIFMLFICLIMIAVSILMIMGIFKKSSKLMAPWVYFTLTGIVMNITIVAIKSFKHESIHNVLFTIIMIVIQVLLFYPIFILYKNTCCRNNNGQLTHEQSKAVQINV